MSPAFSNRNTYRFFILALLMLLCVISFMISLRMGALKLSFSSILQALLPHTPSMNSYGSGSTGAASFAVHHQIICNIRLPRTLVAGLVGMSLALSGCILQGIMRNPLASPHLIGISAGAGLAGIFILIVMPSAFHLLTPAAFAGALVTTVLIYALAWQQGLKPTRLILAGVAVSSFLGAWITALMIFFPERVHSVLGFMVGGLSARSWKHVHIILPYAGLGFVLTALMAKRLNILLLGDDTARNLGLNVEKKPPGVYCPGRAAGRQRSECGRTPGFCGTDCPPHDPLYHRLGLPLPAAGQRPERRIPADAVRHTLARVVLDPVEIPVGIIMALLGAPFFLYLLRSNFKRE